MKIDKRSFLKCAGAFAGTLLLPRFYVSYDHLDRDYHGDPILNKNSRNLCLPLDEPLELKVATWNICGIPKKLDTPLSERMPLINKMIYEFSPDLIGFQEAFLLSSRREIIEGLSKTNLKFHTYFPSRLGSGLLTVSSFPILDKDFTMYNSQSDPINLNGEWYAGKGVGRTRINIKKGINIDFFNTHLHAGNLNIRRNQINQCTNFVSRYLENDKPTFLASDLNCSIGDGEYSEFMKLGNFVRVMDNDFGSIEHIHAGNLKHNSVRNIKTWEIPGEYNGIQLSDHPGYVSKILIEPYS